MLLSIICHSYFLLRKYMIAEHNERWQIPLDICHWPFLMFVLKRHLQPTVKTYQLLLACNKYMQHVICPSHVLQTWHLSLRYTWHIMMSFVTYHDLAGWHVCFTCFYKHDNRNRTQTLLTTWRLSFIIVFCNIPFLSLSSVATTAPANNDKVII